MSKSNFYMWGERGLVATFFADLSNMGSDAIMDFLTETVEFSINPFNDNDVVAKIDIIIEPDFGNRGFGHPDAIIVVYLKDTSKKVFIIEAKLTTFEKASMTNRDQDGFNSSLNGQLELNYRLSLALSKFNAGNTALLEDASIAQHYSNDQQRKLVKSYVLTDVVSKVCDTCIDNYYHIVITGDTVNPLNTVSDELSPKLPKLYNEAGEDCWKDKRNKFGWVNYDKLNKTIICQNRLFPNTYEINNGLLTSKN